MIEAVHILIAEDDGNDAFLMQTAFQEAGGSNQLFIVRDGAEAIAYLNGDGAFADRGDYPWPGLLLLDLKMPRVDGFGVLKWLKRRRHALPPLVVVVHTSSKHDFDFHRALELGADAYWLKPHTFGDLVNSARALCDRLREPPPRPATVAQRRAEASW
jgi:DNA-binding response OmpR family regulator